MVNKRKGIQLSKLDLEVVVSKEMIDNPKNMYIASYRIEWGRGDDYIIDTTVYCNTQHDLGINMVLRKHRLLMKRIKLIEITNERQIGISVALTQEIKKWRITDEKG